MTPKQVNFEELKLHCHSHDAWVGIYGKVYDMTSWIQNHPVLKKFKNSHHSTGRKSRFRNFSRKRNYKFIRSLSQIEHKKFNPLKSQIHRRIKNHRTSSLQKF
jgi:hypothetical protein